MEEAEIQQLFGERIEHALGEALPKAGVMNVLLERVWICGFVGSLVSKIFCFVLGFHNGFSLFFIFLIKGRCLFLDSQKGKQKAYIMFVKGWECGAGSLR